MRFPIFKASILIRKLPYKIRAISVPLSLQKLIHCDFESMVQQVLNGWHHGAG